jgi:hypothetical protein
LHLNTGKPVAASITPAPRFSSEWLKGKARAGARVEISNACTFGDRLRTAYAPA